EGRNCPDGFHRAGGSGGIALSYRGGELRRAHQQAGHRNSALRISETIAAQSGRQLEHKEGGLSENLPRESSLFTYPDGHDDRRDHQQRSGYSERNDHGEGYG